GPCLLPGNSVNTQQAGYKNYVSSTPATGWDTFEMLANNIPAIQPGVQWNEVGSGPYYVENPINPDVGYTLHTNPDYNAPVGCAGQPGCMPLKGSYQGTVDVIWEASGDTQGLNAMADGQADSAGFFTPETGTVLGLGNYTLLPGIPGLTTFFDLVNLNFSEVGYADLGAPPTNIPATFFQNIALRNFLVNAYPYTSVDQTYNCVDGVCFGEDYGGAIPHGMGDYYPSNITWPGGNPVSSPSTPGNVAWWWAQANNVSSQWYDSQLASCTTGSPCTWDDMTTLGNTETIGEFELWNAEIFNLSGGALEPGYFELSTQDICSLGCPPGQNPLPIYPYGWVADYPDPSDFMAPMYYPDNSYTAPDAVSEVLQASPNNATSCPHDYSAWSNLTYYANIGLLPTACQGAGYDTMTAWENAAAHESNINLRMLEYNLIEHIANELALYIYNPQVVVAIEFGDWIEGSTTNTNPAIGGAGIQLWYDWGYAANYFDVTFRESGLPAGADWGVTLAGETLGSNSTSNVTSAPLTNGTYPYNVGSLSGYLAMPSNGTVVINGSNVFLSVFFSCLGCGEVFAVAFQEGGLSAGTPWGVVVTGLGGTVSLNGTATTLSANLPEGSYNYTPESVPGYYPPVPGQVNVTGNTTVNLTYSGSVSISYYAVSFIETGLPSGGTWSILINGTTITRINSTLSTTLVNGSYAWGIVSLPSGCAAIPSEGDVVISGAPVTVHVTITTPTILPRSSGGFSTPDWLIIGSVVLVALGVGLLVWRVKVQRGRPPDPKTNPALGPPLP
ncbi:MAG: hypothetical protein WB852_00535, partial [Thermoplasmata archaeon]